MEKDRIANEVKLVWLIDLSERTVTIDRPGCAVETLRNPGSVQGFGPVAGFNLVMSRSGRAYPE